jgi:hypothetical protein
MNRLARLLDGLSHGELALFAALVTAGVAALALALRSVARSEFVVLGLAALVVGAHALDRRRRRS